MNSYLSAVLFASGLAFAAAASVPSFYIEGRLLINGRPQVSAVYTNATVAFYDCAEGGSALAAQTIELKTDASGYFSVPVSGFESIGDKLYLEITPDPRRPGEQIRPRLKAAAAPYAIHAEKAEIFTTGNTSVRSAFISDIHATTADVNGTMTLAGCLTLNGGLDGVSTLNIRQVTMNSGASVRMLAANGMTGADFNSFRFDRNLSATDTSGFFSFTYNQTVEDRSTAAADGFVTVGVRANVGGNDDSYHAHVTVTCGDLTIVDSMSIGNTGSQAFFWTFPVRRGESVYVKLVNKRSLTVHDVSSYAGIKYYSFGVK